MAFPQVTHGGKAWSSLCLAVIMLPNSSLLNKIVIKMPILSYSFIFQKYFSPTCVRHQSHSSPLLHGGFQRFPFC